MCDFPKQVYVPFVGDDGYTTEFSFAVPCGKCYDCRRSIADSFVLRCRSEFQHSVCAYFVTLTYDNKNVRYYNPCDRVARRKELDYIESMPCKYFGMYKNFVLDKIDAANFCKSMQDCIKRYSSSLLFRFVLNGEYGLYTQRPHYHALFFSPLFFNLQDFVKLLQQCWKFGNVTVSPVTDSRINYVAKHFMKTDVGSSIQQSVAPIFQKRSTYRGGIGRDLVFDKSILINYCRDLNYFQVGRYKIGIPRYIRKKLHPGKFIYEELKDLCERSYDSLIDRLCSCFFDLKEIDLKITPFSDKKDRLHYAISIMRDMNYDLVHNKLKEFYMKKFSEHYLKLNKKEMLL